MFIKTVTKRDRPKLIDSKKVPLSDGVIKASSSSLRDHIDEGEHFILIKQLFPDRYSSLGHIRTH